MSCLSWYHSTSNNSKRVPDRAIFTMADQYKVVYGLSTALFSMTLNNPNPVFKVALYFDAEYLIKG